MKQTLSILAFFLALPLTAAATGCAPRTVLVSPEKSHTITVIGEGEASADPDRVTVRLGVEERAPTADEAMRLANSRMAAVLRAVKAQGVQEKDLQTTDLSVYFERDHNPPPRPVPLPRPGSEVDGPDVAVSSNLEPTTLHQPPAGHYVVRNTVVASWRELDKIGEVIGAAMEAGANQLHGFDLTLHDPTELHEQARKRAIQHAVEKAKQLAKEAGVKLGPVIEISEIGGSPHPSPMMNSRNMVRAESAVPVEQGQLFLSQQVQVVFALGE